MTHNQQIKYLNDTVKCRLAPSPIHGVGVFALISIEKGEKCYCKQEKIIWYNLPFSMFGELRKEIVEIILQRYVRVPKGSQFLSPNADQRLTSFMNHNKDNPNYDIHTDCALCNISEGEELLENYNIL